MNTEVEHKSVHCMIDCETFGTNNEAVILSIGCVKFDPHAHHEIIDKFHVAVDPASCVGLGLKPDMDTIMWWMHQSRDEARRAFMAMERIDLASALDGFISWFGGDKPVWGYGATFDNVIMRSSFKAAGLVCPWSYKNDRCFRTFSKLTSFIEKPTSYGVVHDALDDAITQAYWLQDIRAFLELNL